MTKRNDFWEWAEKESKENLENNDFFDRGKRTLEKNEERRYNNAYPFPPHKNKVQENTGDKDSVFEKWFLENERINNEPSKEEIELEEIINAFEEIENDNKEENNKKETEQVNTAPLLEEEEEEKDNVEIEDTQAVPEEENKNLEEYFIKKRIPWFIRNIIYPTVWKGKSLIVLDSGDMLFNKLFPLRYGISKIMRFDLDADFLNYNVMDELQEEKAEVQCELLANSLRDYTAEDFSKMEKIVSRLFPVLLLHCKTSNYPDKSLYGVQNFISACFGKDEELFLDNMINSAHCSDSIHENLSQNSSWLKIYKSSDYLKEGIETVVRHLNAFLYNNIRKRTRTSDFVMKNMLNSKIPFTLFVNMQDIRNETYKRIIQSFLIIWIERINACKEKHPPVLFLAGKETASLYKKTLNQIITNKKKLWLCAPDFLTRLACKTAVNNFKKTKNELYGKRENLLKEIDVYEKPDPKKKDWYQVPKDIYVEVLFHGVEEKPDEEVNLAKIFDEPNDEETKTENKILEKEKADLEFIQSNEIHKVNLYFPQDLSEEIKKIENLLEYETYKRVKERMIKHYGKCGIICILYGESGCGKTETVLQIAKNTGRNIVKADLSIIRKKHIGSSEKAVKKMFDSYSQINKEVQNTPILFINEADGMFQRRTDISAESNNKTIAMDFNTIQNMLLDKMENFEGIMLATTNFIQLLDPAFERRILYKVEFPFPDKTTQAKIWKEKIPGLKNEVINKITSKFNFSGGNITNISKKMLMEFDLMGNDMTYSELIKLCEKEKIKDKKIAIGFTA